MFPLFGLSSMLIFFIPCILSESIRVLRSDVPITERGKLSQPLSNARLIDNRTMSVEDLSVCIRFNLLSIGDYTKNSKDIGAVVHIATTTTKEIRVNSDIIYLQYLAFNDWEFDQYMDAITWFGLSARYTMSYVYFGHPISSFAAWVIRDADDEIIFLSPRIWNHLCFSFDKSRLFVKAVLNGELTNLNRVAPEVANSTLPPQMLQNVLIGQCNDAVQKCSAVGGKFSDFNLWDRPLSTQDMLDFTTCSNMKIKGNIVSWDNAQFQLTNMSQIYENVHSVCRPMNKGHTLIPGRRSFHDHRDICTKMRANVAVVSSQSIQEELMKSSPGGENATCVGNVWTGYSDAMEEGVFASSSDQLGSHIPWALGEPNGERHENCAVLTSQGLWRDYACSKAACGHCFIDENIVLHIRGLCSESVFDHRFSWTGEIVNGKFAYYGIFASFLAYYPEAKQWQLKLYRPDSNATYGATKGEAFPFGTHEWRFYNDPCYTDSDGNILEEVELLLNLNHCNEDEFNCGDGTCIAMDKRCDGRLNCPDQSDEVECKIFSVHESYLNYLAPGGVTEESLLPVNISVDVMKVLEILEIEGIVRLQLRIHLAWNDQRLDMYNLKSDSKFNFLTLEMRDLLWIPKIVFFNTDEKHEIVNDKKAFGLVRRNGNFTLDPITELHNGYNFLGKENPIVLSRSYTYDYRCDFDMGNYPFDAQKCSAVFVVKGIVEKYLELVPHQLQYIGPVDLNQYYVHSSHMHVGTTHQDKRSVYVELTFRRRILSIILTTYLPTTLICVVCYTTNFYSKSFFEAIVAVNFMSLFLLLTLFKGMSERLPQTAYIKNIDVWWLFILLMPLSEVLIHTMVDNLRDDRSNEKSPHGSKATQTEIRQDVSNLLLLARLGIPTIFSAFFTLYFLYGIIVSNIGIA